jgi:hypothetical protein
MNNDIRLRSINEIIKEKFLVPSYQRGYRWEKRQITELLDDIDYFSSGIPVGSKTRTGNTSLKSAITQPESELMHHLLEE